MRVEKEWRESVCVLRKRDSLCVSMCVEKEKECVCSRERERVVLAALKSKFKLFSSQKNFISFHFCLFAPFFSFWNETKTISWHSKFHRLVPLDSIVFNARL